MLNLLLTYSPFVLWPLWAGTTWLVAWLMVRANDVMEWLLGL